VDRGIGDPGDAANPAEMEKEVVPWMERVLAAGQQIGLISALVGMIRRALEL